MGHSVSDWTVAAFTASEVGRAKLLLAGQVASMMGRKMEEDDWTAVYCRAKDIPETSWSNLNIDVMYGGVGVEHKLLRCPNLRGRSIRSVCGTTRMHPAATRSIRIEDVTRPAGVVAYEVLQQYNALIDGRSERVRSTKPECEPDMRIGWLLWESSLTEFLYFEERMRKVDPGDYVAEWNETPPRGARKGSKSLWLYDRDTQQKRYSVTTSAGIKIQPYFDVPTPTDPNLYYFRVQSEPVGADTVVVWVSATTARGLLREVGELSREAVSEAILRVSATSGGMGDEETMGDGAGVAVPVTAEAFAVLCAKWEGVSDEHRAQLFLENLRDSKG